jgi:hypothetical protein
MGRSHQRGHGKPQEVSTTVTTTSRTSWRKWHSTTARCSPTAMAGEQPPLEDLQPVPYGQAPRRRRKQGDSSLTSCLYMENKEKSK